MKPVRIQRSRQHKQISPNGLPILYVGRPTKYGNPFQVSCQSTLEFRKIQIEKYYQMILNNVWTEPTIRTLKQELKGKNLSCWCKISEPCHADVLLQIANEK